MFIYLKHESFSNNNNRQNQAKTAIVLFKINIQIITDSAEAKIQMSWYSQQVLDENEILYEQAISLSVTCELEIQMSRYSQQELDKNEMLYEQAINISITREAEKNTIEIVLRSKSS